MCTRQVQPKFLPEEIIAAAIISAYAEGSDYKRYQMIDDFYKTLREFHERRHDQAATH
jgi:hypothetical protein